MRLYSLFTLLLITICFLLFTTNNSFASRMPLPSIQQPAPEFTVGALFPNKVRYIYIYIFLVIESYFLSLSFSLGIQGFEVI